MELRTTKSAARAFFKLTVFLLFSALTTSCYYDNEEYLYPGLPGGSCDTSGVTYTGFVAPLLSANCNSCHSASNPSGGVVTSTYDGLIQTVNSGQFRKAINHLDGALPMPQGGNMLTSCELSKIDAWINQGAPQN